MKPEVGQKVYLKGVNNASKISIREKVVKKVGRKYFFVGKEDENKEYFWTKFRIEDLSQVTDYSPDWKLYFDKQQMFDEVEAKQLYDGIRTKFQYYFIPEDLTLEKLREINLIIHGGLDEEEKV